MCIYVYIIYKVQTSLGAITDADDTLEGGCVCSRMLTYADVC